MAALISLALLLLTFVAPAWGQTEVSFLTRTFSESGIKRESPAVTVPPGGITEIRATLDALDAEWDDPALFVTLAIEVSKDGGAKWEFFGGVNVFGGTRTKAGTLPHVSPGTGGIIPEGWQFRATLVTNKRVRIGVTGTLR